MPDTKFKPGNEAFDLIVDLRSNLRDPGGDAREFWGEMIYRSMVSDAKDAIERTWDNPQAAAFLSSSGNTREAMRAAVNSGDYDTALKSIPPLPYSNVHDPKAVYHQTPAAAAPEKATQPATANVRERERAIWNTVETIGREARAADAVAQKAAATATPDAQTQRDKSSQTAYTSGSIE